MRVSIDCSSGHHKRTNDLYNETRKLLNRYHIFPKKRLGQNFMIEPSLLQSMISYADLKEDDVVLEVGAGLGFLTQLLSSSCRKVIAIEMDPKLVAILQSKLSSLRNIDLIEGDVLTADVPPFDKVVSLPPYSISSPLLFWLLERPFEVAVLTFQEEFARRLNSNVGDKDYSRLTVATYYRAEVESLDRVPKSSFYPPPDVDSAVVRLKPKPAPFRVKSEKSFFELVQSVFTQRNRKLRNAVIPFLIKLGVDKRKTQKLADELTFHDKRVRELAPEDFGALTNEILEKVRILQ